MPNALLDDIERSYQEMAAADPMVALAVERTIGLHPTTISQLKRATDDGSRPTFIHVAGLPVYADDTLAINQIEIRYRRRFQIRTDKLYWVEPTRCVDVYLTNAQIEALQSRETDGFNETQVRRLIEAVTDGVEALDD